MAAGARRTLACLLGQSADWAVEELILQQAERSFDVGPLRVGQLAVDPVVKLLNDDLPLRFEVLRQHGDDGAKTAPVPPAQEAACLLLHDCLCRRDVLAPVV